MENSNKGGGRGGNQIAVETAWIPPQKTKSNQWLVWTESNDVVINLSNYWINPYPNKGLLPIAVIAVEPGDKASFVHSCIQMRLMGQHNEN